MLLALPTVHAWHMVAPLDGKLPPNAIYPGLHSKQEIEPDSLATFPVLQLEHESLLFPPACSLNLPGGHKLHIVSPFAPNARLNLPALHGLQASF